MNMRNELQTPLNDISGFSKQEAKSPEIRQKPFRIEASLKDALVSASIRARNKNIVLQADISGDLPDMLLGDKASLSKALSLMLNNASESISSGYIRLTANLDGSPQNGLAVIVFVIANTEPDTSFGQLKAEKAGFANACYRQIIELIGGTLSVSGEPGKGTISTIKIPFNIADESIGISKKNKKPLLHKKRVLLISGSPFMRETTERFLLSLNMRIKSVSDISSAKPVISALQGEGNAFDIVLLDTPGTNKSAPEIIEELNGLTQNMSEFIVICPMGEIVQAKSYGNCMFVNSPFVPSELAEKISSALSRRAGKSSPEGLAFRGMNSTLRRDSKANPGAINGKHAGLPDSGAPLINGANFSEGLRRFSNKRDKYANVLGRFLTELEKETLLISEAFYAGALQDASNLVHKIKGIAGNLGVTNLYESAVTLEKQLKNGIADEQALNGFIAETAASSKSISLFIESCNNSEPARNESDGNSKEARELLEKLRHSAEMFDPISCEQTIAKLKGKKWNNIDADKLEKIFNLSERYNYDEAIKEINSLLTEMGK